MSSRWPPSTRKRRWLAPPSRVTAWPVASITTESPAGMMISLATTSGRQLPANVTVPPALTAARLRGQEYLLERRLFRRRSTGEVIEQDRDGGTVWTRFAFPTWWHYDVLRGLEYLRRANVAPDERMAEAIDLVASKRSGDGWWLLETQYPGEMPVKMDEGVGQPSRWNTLRALRVSNWYSAGGMVRVK